MLNCKCRVRWAHDYKAFIGSELRYLVCQTWSERRALHTDAQFLAERAQGFVRINRRRSPSANYVHKMKIGPTAALCYDSVARRWDKDYGAAATFSINLMTLGSRENNQTKFLIININTTLAWTEVVAEARIVKMKLTCRTRERYGESIALPTFRVYTQAIFRVYQRGWQARYVSNSVELLITPG